MELQFKQEHFYCEKPAADDLLFAFQDNAIYLLQQRLPCWRDIASLSVTSQPLYCFAQWKNQRCLLVQSVDLSGLAVDWDLQPVRQSHAVLGEEVFRLAGYANHIHYWRATHAFCGRCGVKTMDKEDERARLCPACGFVTYPRISPCVIVLVTRGKELLLARSPHFPAGIYSTLAGFIEPGESAEETVQREVKEEVGIEISQLNYFASQPWPFPDSLMLGFTAEYASGDLRIDPRELEDAQWFSPGQLPPLPNPMSIARRLIEHAIKNV